jgi:hypothetical protein
MGKLTTVSVPEEGRQQEALAARVPALLLGDGHNCDRDDDALNVKQESDVANQQLRRKAPKDEKMRIRACAEEGQERIVWAK